MSSAKRVSTGVAIVVMAVALVAAGGLIGRMSAPSAEAQTMGRAPGGPGKSAGDDMSSQYQYKVVRLNCDSVGPNDEENLPLSTNPSYSGNDESYWRDYTGKMENILNKYGSFGWQLKHTERRRDVQFKKEGPKNTYLLLYLERRTR